MTDERIGGYLETRRIKNPMKFRRYIQMFRREMQDGFLKKRFTNRNRKEQRRKEIEKQLQWLSNIHILQLTDKWTNIGSIYIIILRIVS